MEDRLRFHRVGYFSNINEMSVQYANGAKNRPDFTYDKLMDMDAMQAFLDEQNHKLTEEMNQKFGGIFESVEYGIKVHLSGLSPNLHVMMKNVLPKDIKEQCEDYLEAYQKRFAKNFNKQSFTQTEYGFAKFPSKNKFGIDLLHDDPLGKTSKDLLSIKGSEEDKYKEILAAPAFLGGCDYHFIFDNDKWPVVEESQFHTKDGTMRESKHPVMAGVKAVLEERGLFDQVDEITIYSTERCVIINMPPTDESTILSVADGLGDYGMNAKLEQDGEELEAALGTMQKNAGMEMK